MAKTVVKLLAGVVGLVGIIVACALTPEVAVWAAMYSYTWVMVAFFLVMMVAGALLSMGVGELVRLVKESASHAE